MTIRFQKNSLSVLWKSVQCRQRRFRHSPLSFRLQTTHHTGTSSYYPSSIIIAETTVSFSSSGNNYGNIGLDLKRQLEEQSVGSPSSSGEMDDPEIKRQRLIQPKYETE